MSPNEMIVSIVVEASTLNQLLILMGEASIDYLEEKDEKEKPAKLEKLKFTMSLVGIKMESTKEGKNAMEIFEEVERASKARKFFEPSNQ